MAWVAYDVFELMNSYPELGQQLKDILFGPRTKESKIANAMTSTKIED